MKAGAVDAVDGPPRQDVAVRPSGALSGALPAPGSKSVTNRLLVLAALADGTSELIQPLDSDDSAAMRGVVEALGAAVAQHGSAWRVRGTGGSLTVPEQVLDARLSGTTMRFGAALAALAPVPVSLDGLPPLRRRPIAPLTAALRQLGASVDDTQGFPPLRVGGGLAGGAVTVDVSDSSQFASAVLLAAPYARRDVELRMAGRSATAYVDLTVAAMRAWGAEVLDLVPGSPGDGWRVRAGVGYRAQSTMVEHDASAAAHLYALAAATGGTVTVTNAAQPTAQPDVAVLDLLVRMGCRVARGSDGVSVTGPPALTPIDCDLSALPDQVTTMAVLAALADGPSTLRGVAVARTHETDRPAALAAELARAGVRVEQTPDSITVHGGTAAGPARLGTHDDHRLAMAFAAFGAAVDGIVVAEPWCVTKTYPGFWSDARALGLSWVEVPA